MQPFASTFPCRRQPRVDGARDDAAEEALLAGVVLEGVDPAVALAEQGEHRPFRQEQPAQPPRLGRVATLVGQDLAVTGVLRRARGPAALWIPHSPGLDEDRIVRRRRVLALLG